jgi:hypothetical protein
VQTTQPIARNGLETFVEGMFIQLGTLLGVRPEGVLCMSAPTPRAGCELRVLGATGRYRAFSGLPLSALRTAAFERLAHQCLEAGRHQYSSEAVALYLDSSVDAVHAAVAMVSLTAMPGELQRRLLEVLSRSLAVGLDNALVAQ